MSDAVERVRKILSGRLEEIEKETQRLKRAAEELSGRDGAKRRTKRPARKARGGSKGSRVASGQRREQLLAALKDKPGSRPFELAAQIGISSTQVSGLLGKARADKLIVKKGAGYFLAD